VLFLVFCQQIFPLSLSSGGGSIHTDATTSRYGMVGGGSRTGVARGGSVTGVVGVCVVHDGGMDGGADGGSVGVGLCGVAGGMCGLYGFGCVSRGHCEASFLSMLLGLWLSFRKIECGIV